MISVICRISRNQTNEGTYLDYKTKLVVARKEGRRVCIVKGNLDIQ